jgi:energy-coupling factor transporter transmembrane protein EcfT
MATAAKFVQPIPIFLAYLVLLAVDVVPIKLFYVSFSLILLFLLLLLFFHTFLSALFLGDALIKLSETLWEYHMPCEVVLYRVDFFKMAAVAMETAKMLKN